MAALEDVARREVLEDLGIMDSSPDPDFDRLTAVAARVFGAKYALVSLLDERRQWFKSCFGVSELEETPVDIAFCAHTLAAETDHFIVPDMLKDERFVSNPFVTGDFRIRFYAGAPIIVQGQRRGPLCVLDVAPREHVDSDQIDQLKDLAAVAGALIGLKNEALVRARTAADLMREEWRHALTLEAGKVGSWVWDVKTGAVDCNETFREMYGFAANDDVTMDRVLQRTAEDDRAAMQGSIEGAFERGDDHVAELRVSDSQRWLMTRGRVYQRDAAGAPTLMMGVALDISASKRSADQTRLLLRELNHRVKNTLAMIQSVARQTIRQTPDPAAFMEAFSGRLRTLSDAHVLLADNDWRGIRLYEIIASELGPDFIKAPDRADVQGPDVLLPADHALGRGLIIHELTTNAYKHGAWLGDSGLVSLHWSLVDGGLMMRWKETDASTLTKPEASGLGIKLIERSLAKVLDSSVEFSFDPDGVRADIWLPLPAEPAE